MRAATPPRGAAGRLLHDLGVGARRGGPGALVSRVLRARIAAVYERTRLIVIEQETGGLPDVRVPEGVRIATLDGTAAEFRSLDELLTSGIRRDFDRRLAAGRECLVARRGDRAIGYTWMSRTVDPAVEGLPLALPEGAAYLWDLFVVRSERGTGVGSALTRARLVWTHDCGMPLGWRAIRPRNRASVRTVEKTGEARILGEIRIERTFGPRRISEVRYGGRPLIRESGPAGTS